MEYGVIQFTLRCNNDHRFESWFASAAAFDKLASAGMIACAVCGSATVEKALMTPRVRDSREQTFAPPDTRPEGPLSAPASPAEQALADLRRKIEAQSEYVGKNFAREARLIHEGGVPKRAIHGEALADEARKLIEDGVPVIPLPFRPSRKSN